MEKRRVNTSEGNAIVADGLTKRFGDVQALSGVDFDVRDGELFGFLGPNGAGKTTTINTLTGLARPDSGSIRIGGIDCTDRPRAAQYLIGVVPDESNLYPELRTRSKITSRFRIPSAPHLRLFLNREILNVALATPRIFLNRKSQICGTSGRVNREVIFERVLSGYDNLCFCASLYGMAKAERHARARELLDTFDLAILVAFCVGLFMVSLHNIRRRWIA